MKNLLLVFLGLVLLASCKKEEQINTNGFVPGMVLEPEAIMENVPQEYLQDSVFIIFKNANGEEKRIKHVAETFLDTNGIINGDTYTIKKLYGEFSDPENIEFIASWIATVMYEENFSLQELLMYSFMLDYAGKIVAGSIAYINREPSNENIWDDSIELLGRTFSGYRQCINEERPGYSEMIFNNQYGLIAFRDREEELWVFDRFE